MELPVDYDKLKQWERRLVRLEYIKQQKGKCYHCKKSLEGPPAKKILKKKLNLRMFPKGFLDWPVHLHHDHNTGLTIGAVHCYCNAVLWQYHGE